MGELEAEINEVQDTFRDKDAKEFKKDLQKSPNKTWESPGKGYPSETGKGRNRGQTKRTDVVEDYSSGCHGGPCLLSNSSPIQIKTTLPEGNTYISSPSRPILVILHTY